jgi:hypothetical protein
MHLIFVEYQNFVKVVPGKFTEELGCHRSLSRETGAVRPGYCSGRGSAGQMRYACFLLLSIYGKPWSNMDDEE